MPAEELSAPMLRMVNGPTPGRLIPLNRKTTLIGRLPDNHVVLKPKYVSKRHATIERIAHDTFVLIDHSHAGTSVNGTRITEPVRLEDGMTIQVCNFQFTFHTRMVTIEEQDDTSTIYHSLDASSSLLLGGVLAPEEKLRLVLEISRGLARTLDLGEIAEGTLGALFQLFPTTQRGFVLLREQPDGPLTPRAIRNRDEHDDGRLALSRTLLDRVLRDGQAILSRDARLDFPSSESVSDRSLRSVLCVPLLNAERQPIGIIQLDTAIGRYDQEDLNLLVAVASLVSIAVEHARLHLSMVEHLGSIQEMEYARQVLQALLPEPRGSLGGADFWACYEPARFVGGDYYGYFPLGPAGDAARGRWAVAVGDVAGKGMPAALLMARLSAEVRSVLQAEPEPAAAVARLNRMLYETGVLDLFVTFLLLVLDPSEYRVTLVNAGHHAPLVRRRSGAVEELTTEQKSLPLGVEPGETFRTGSTTLAPGEVVVLFTDGVIDALNRGGVEFGLERLRQVIAATPGRAAQLGETIIAAVHRHAAGRSQADDITLLCLGRPAEPRLAP